MPDTVTTISVPADRNGPPHSGNGGYSCGLMAQAIPAATVTTTLRKPPPLDHPIHGTATDGQVRWTVGDTLVAESAADTLDLTVPAAPTWQQVMDAKAAFDAEAFHRAHPFPPCYVCGPSRSPDEALVLLPAPVASTELVAWPWQPRPALAGADGRLATEELRAALDCPSGWSVWDYSSMHLLGRLTGSIYRRPEPGQDLIVGAWSLGREGRKGNAGSAIWTRDGECLAAARAIWIAVPEAPRPDYV